MSNDNYDKTVHLSFIQTVIARLANNSFLIRGWLVAILVGSLAIYDKISKNIESVPAFYFSLIMVFWISDTYFLYQERIFRKLYDLVNENNFHNYSMRSPTSFNSFSSLFFEVLRSFLSLSVIIFYIPLQVIIFLLV